MNPVTLSIALLAFILLPFSTLVGQENEPDDKDKTTLMTGEALLEILNEIADEGIEGEAPSVQFTIRGIPMICIFDVQNDRMRIVSPIKRYEEVTEEEKDEMMRSHFHGALDGRYAVTDGILFAAYIHPLSPLKKGDVLSGVFQVASLHVSFGKEYNSGLLSFGDGDRGERI
ncbi:MAG: hypothetical protein AAGC68_16720 [Verrucomicrobiota bacterium]